MKNEIERAIDGFPPLAGTVLWVTVLVACGTCRMQGEPAPPAREERTGEVPARALPGSSGEHVADPGSPGEPAPPAAEAPRAAASERPAAIRDAVGVEWIFSEPAGVYLSKTEITVSQYRSCVKAGPCTLPGTGGHCNWGLRGHDDHPVNCVYRDQAAQMCGYLGGRLPTSEEWYAEASDRGTREYPWGDRVADCEYAVMTEGGSGCGRRSTWPVCSKPKGLSVSGLCDLSGNVWEWVEDGDDIGFGVLRGGSWLNISAVMVAADAVYRANHEDEIYCRFGVRCARTEAPRDPDPSG